MLKSIALLCCLTLCSCGVVKTDLDQKYAATQTLENILSHQPDEVKVRYKYRNPEKTLAFIGVLPGDTVVEVLPGGGWYSRILAPLVGEDGKLIGIDYASSMWPFFGGFATPEFIEKRKTWDQDWIKKSSQWGDQLAPMLGYEFSAIPAELEGTADVALFIRAMHNLSRFEKQGQYLTTAMADTYKLLKPGGRVGIVQHLADESMPDDWAQGQNGYLKKSRVMSIMKSAGFEFIRSSAVNLNPEDRPTLNDHVWRLPPSLSSSRNDAALANSYKKMGESNRMTLIFRKPKR